MENVQDFRPFLRRYKGMTADEVGREYNLRVSEAKVFFFLFVFVDVFWEWLAALRGDSSQRTPPTCCSV